MKRLFSLLLVFVLAFSTMLLPCNATAQEGSEVIYLEDGGYLVISTETYTIARASNTIGGRKAMNRYSADHVLQWTYTLDGQFRFNPGVSAECVNATCTIDIFNTRWVCTNKSATPSGATAIGRGTVVFKIMNITTTTVPVDISIVCDTYGNLV